MPQTFCELITTWGGVPAFKADLGLKYVTAQKMWQRNSVAPRYWDVLIKKGRIRGLRYEHLMQMRKARPVEQARAAS